MVKAKREYVFATSLLSGSGVVLILASLLTSNWIVGDAKYTVEGIEEDEANSNVNYGLFSGIIEDFIAGAKSYEIQLTCNMENNICAFLCGETSEIRQNQLINLYNGVPTIFDTSCPKVKKSSKRDLKADEKEEEDTTTPEFLNFGCWLSTIIFAITTEIFGGISTALSIWNSAGNPSQTCFSLTGVKIFNGIAAFFAILTLIMFIVEYAARISDNLMILNTITGVMTTEKSSLGYSFWFILIALICFIGSIGLVYLRQYLLEKEPPKKIDIDDIDDNIILF